MKITNSSIAMASTHEEFSYNYTESATMEMAKSKDGAAAILTLSKEASGKSYKEAMAEYEKHQKEEAKKKQQENEARSMQQMMKNMKTQKSDGQFKLPDDDEGMSLLKVLKQILAALRGEKLPKDGRRFRKQDFDFTDLRSAGFQQTEESSFKLSSASSVSAGAIAQTPKVGTTASGTVWQRITATSGFAVETEATTFASVGMAQTSDGRSISFNVEVSMSRAFMSQIDMLEVKDYIKTDPLMINLDTNAASVSDQKFFFDLDSDGSKEEISFAGKGSGFLALDQNGDGKINDGSELFGTKSGDGFNDLSAYDEDGNGWIDENDSVFSKLKVWTKDENGNDRLLDLKEADVGAIYLGNADTQFSLKDEQNNLNAEIRKTGIYLKESTGFVGTLNHIDLAV